MPIGLNSDAFAAGSLAGDDARLGAAIDDVFLPDHARLDDRTRGAILSWLDDAVATIERDLRRHVARALAGRGDEAAAQAVIDATTARRRLDQAGVLRAPALMAEVIPQVRCRLLATDLPIATDAGEGPGLLMRLFDLPDRAVAAAARALLAADGAAAGARGDLPAELYHDLAWTVAAALRLDDDGRDRLWAEAVLRCLAGHDEGERLAAMAERLVAAIDPLPAEVPALLLGALADRRPELFAATLAQAVAIGFDDARALLLDPVGEGLWTALRAAGAGRADIARVALILAEADPRRDIDALAERLDALAATDPATARASLAPLTLPLAFRRAIARMGLPR